MMKCFSKRALFGLVPALLAALVLGVPTAAPEISLQPVTVACSVDSPFTLATDPATLTQLTLALTAMTDPTCGISQTDPTAVPDPSFAVGGGYDSAGEHFSFSAHLNTPASPSGYAHFTSPFGPIDVQGHVTCLSFISHMGGGNDAEIGFAIEKGGTGGRYLVVEDNGEPSGTTPDQLLSLATSETRPSNCFEQASPGFYVVQGNIVVK